MTFKSVNPEENKDIPMVEYCDDEDEWRATMSIATKQLILADITLGNKRGKLVKSVWALPEDLSSVANIHISQLIILTSVTRDLMPSTTLQCYLYTCTLTQAQPYKVST